MIESKQSPVFILLGKFGDLILMSPAFRQIYERTGVKPVVVASTEFSTILEGMSWVISHPMNYNWLYETEKARALCKEIYGGAIVPQWWHCTPGPELIEEQYRGSTTLQCHRLEFGVNIEKWGNYMISMWGRAGFTKEEMMRYQVEFDRRDAQREAQLVRMLRRNLNKPMLVVQFGAQVSPLAAVPEVWQVLLRYKHAFNIVDISNVRAHRLYDLMGLFEAAVGCVTCDTSSLHMMGGAGTPYIAFTANGWGASIPKGNCVLEIKYDTAVKHLHEMIPVLDEWAQTPVKMPAFSGGGGMMAVAR
jgi:hypothetical protein